eukprot:CAMPEP_0202728562 /NCGR_PEP_ID=MMETSP1385-20130828/185690_1 /ASSEMBLY_ACC=CAM_ASM_000861 /TAXON_ID=933848 /ORGANISM="Elphidium margaritaceum" /LENGTH=284 /DNA_ID=CAMNT_0049394813 /DNA_START=105 /DNA_END=956 /DNA_ORIENTATION=+
MTCVESQAYKEYTEGHYRSVYTNDKRSRNYNTLSGEYEHAQEEQCRYLLNCAKLKVKRSDSKSEKSAAKPVFLDCGCGYGSLLLAAKNERNADVTGLTLSVEQRDFCRNSLLLAAKNERNADVTGLTLSVEQRDFCRNLGLEKVAVRSFTELTTTFAENTFDAVIANGCLEHLVSIDEAIADNGNAAYADQLAQFYRVLKPGGRLVVTMIHFRGDCDPRKVKRHCWEFLVESVTWCHSVLVGFYSGWYPSRNAFAEIGTSDAIGFEIERNDITTDHYLVTSMEW